MDTLKIKKDFDWVLKVLKSCEKMSQVLVSIDLLNVFFKKWSYYISEIEMMSYNRKFNYEKSITINNILELEN
jgi:hypothetical protein